MSRDAAALFWSFGYVGLVVVAGELVSRLGGAREVARKLIHVGVGLWIFGTLLLFRSPYMAVIPPLTAAVGNWVIHRHRLLRSVEADPDNLGTVYFAISFAVLILFGWENPSALAGGVMAMTIGDAAASLAGRRWGRRRFLTLGGQVKSLEGSLAMFAATFLAVLVTLPVAGYLGGGVARITWEYLLGLPALAAVGATCLEAMGIKGRDNLWVPLGTGGLLFAAYLLPPGLVAALGAGAVLALFIGVTAWLRGSLSPSGVLGAVITGTLVFGLGGLAGGVALVGFFLSSSLLSRLFRERKAELEAEYAKTGTRDLMQALANGGVAAACALLLGVTGEARWMAALLGALAAANADTWATELGVLSHREPRLLTTLKRVPRGTSGAVSAAGTGASLGGAAFVGLVAALADARLWSLLPAVALAGLAGSLLDSLLGATAQASYQCPACGTATERRVHRCGAPTRLRRGLPWLGNDLVNLMATVLGAGLAFVLAKI